MMTLQTNRIHSTAEGERLYVIGDIHGQLHLLRRLYSLILDDLKKRPVETYRVICLGDLIDRGESSRGVIDFLMAVKSTEPWIILRGNHEDMALQVLENIESFAEWTRHGGLETLLSFGVPVQSLMRGNDIAASHAAFVAKLGMERSQFMNSLPYSTISGSYFFCHAGINPSLSIAQQQPRDLMWIREAFLTSSQNFEYFIVHGHTPVERIDVRHNRINIDTGAYITGRLTCLVLEGHRAHVFDTRDNEFASIF